MENLQDVSVSDDDFDVRVETANPTPAGHPDHDEAEGNSQSFRSPENTAASRPPGLSPSTATPTAHAADTTSNARRKSPRLSNGGNSYYPPALLGDLPLAVRGGLVGDIIVAEVPLPGPGRMLNALGFHPKKNSGHSRALIDCRTFYSQLPIAMQLAGRVKEELLVTESGPAEAGSAGQRNAARQQEETGGEEEERKHGGGSASGGPQVRVEAARSPDTGPASSHPVAVTIEVLHMGTPRTKAEPATLGKANDTPKRPVPACSTVKQVVFKDEHNVVAAMTATLPALLASVGAAPRPEAITATALFTPGEDLVSPPILLQRLLDLVMNKQTRQSLLNEWVARHLLADKRLRAALNKAGGGPHTSLRRVIKDSVVATASANLFHGLVAPQQLAQGSTTHWALLRELWCLWIAYLRVMGFPKETATRHSLATDASNVISRSELYKDEDSPFRLLAVESFATGVAETIVYPALVRAMDELFRRHKEAFYEAIEPLIAAAATSFSGKRCLLLRRSGLPWVLWTLIAVGVSLADWGSDIWLGAQHLMNGDTFWGVGTLVFAFLPSFVQTATTLFRYGLPALKKMLIWYCWPVTRFSSLVERGNKHKKTCIKLTSCLLCPASCSIAMLLLGITTALIPVTFLVIVPFVGPGVSVYWFYRYTRYLHERPLMRANIRAYGIMELLLESIPQLLLQMYIYCVKGELMALGWAQIIPVTLSLVAVVKAACLGDAEVFRNPDFRMRLPPFLFFTSAFRIIDIGMGVAAATVVTAYLRGYLWAYYVFGFLLVSPMFQSSYANLTKAYRGPAPVSPGLSKQQTTRSQRWKKNRCIMVAAVLCVATVGLPFLFLYAVGLLIAFIGYHLLPLVARYCCCSDGKPAVPHKDWKHAEGSSLKLLPRVDALLNYSSWTLTLGPSFLFRLRNEYDLKRQGGELNRDPSCTDSVAPDLYPPLLLRLITFGFAFVLSVLVDKGQITADLNDDPLSQGYTTLTRLCLFGSVPMMVCLWLLALTDRTPWGRRLLALSTQGDIRQTLCSSQAKTKDKYRSKGTKK